MHAHPSILRCSARRPGPTPSSSSARQPLVNVPIEKPSARAFRDFSNTMDLTPICAHGKAETPKLKQCHPRLLIFHTQHLSSCMAMQVTAMFSLSPNTLGKGDLRHLVQCNGRCQGAKSTSNNQCLVICGVAAHCDYHKAGVPTLMPSLVWLQFCILSAEL